MSYLAVSNRVYSKNALGQFAARCERAGVKTVEKAVTEGAKMSRKLAPEGSKVDPRTVPLKDSIFSHNVGTYGFWYSVARHAMPQEFGAGPHVITGDPSLGFWWEAEGRNWIPAAVYFKSPGLIDVINHPGNPAQPFLRPAYEVVMANVMRWAKRYYPG